MSTDCRASLKRQITMSIGVAAALSLVGFALTRTAGSQQHEKAPPSLDEAVSVSNGGERITEMETAKVIEETLSADIHATGQVLYPSDQTVKISPRLQGRIKGVFVRVGDHVTAGQTLALLESVDAATAQTTARQNENKLRLAKLTLDRQVGLYRLGTPEVTAAMSALNQAHSAACSAREALDRTRQQASLGGFVDPPLEAAQSGVIGAKSNLAQARSDLAQAEREHGRKVKLVEIGVAAASDLDASTNVLEKANSAVRSGEESFLIAEQALAREQKAHKSKLYEEQQVRGAEANSRQAEVQETAATTALRLAKAAILTNLQQARSDYQAALTDAQNAHRVLGMLGNPDGSGAVRVLAPIDGVITDRQVSAGQIVDQSQMTPWQMFVLSSTRTVWIDADVFEKDVASAAPRQSVSIQVNALPGRELRGAILRIAPSVDRASRAFKVRSEIANPNGLLKEGMYASVTIHAGRGRCVLTVPASAIQHDGDSDYVYMPRNGKYVRRKVEIGAHFRDRYVVTSGLKSGEMVVSRGAIFLASQANGG